MVLPTNRKRISPSSASDPTLEASIAPGRSSIRSGFSLRHTASPKSTNGMEKFRSRLPIGSALAMQAIRLNHRRALDTVWKIRTITRIMGIQNSTAIMQRLMPTSRFSSSKRPFRRMWQSPFYRIPNGSGFRLPASPSIWNSSVLASMRKEHLGKNSPIRAKFRSIAAASTRTTLSKGAKVDRAYSAKVRGIRMYATMG